MPKIDGYEPHELRAMQAIALREKVEHVKGAPQTRCHHCHWPGCKTQVPPAMWGCKRHWFKLPKGWRDQVWAEYEIGQEWRGDPSDGYLAVAVQLQTWIRLTHGCSECLGSGKSVFENKPCQACNESGVAQ